MPDLPRPLAEFLLASVSRDRSPAYLEVSPDGRLVDCGGHLGMYGLASLERGRPVTDQAVVLQGLLPTDGRDTCLPCVHTGNGAPADIYLFRDHGTDWVLLLDASAFDIRSRSVQQAANQRRLDRQSPLLLSSVLRALDMVVLERGQDRRLVPVSDTPPWLSCELPGASRFLESFMIDAEELWRTDRDGASVRSGPWHEDGLMPEGEWWDATALRQHGRNLIIVTRSFPMAAERQLLLQTGRERSLQLAARTAELADTSGQLERECAARQRAAATNRLLAHAVQGSHEMICVTDLDDCFTFVNRSFLEQYGYSEHEVIGHHVSLIVSPANPPDGHAQVLQATRAGGWTGELLNRRKDGSDFPVSLSTSQIRDDLGRVAGLLGVARDITERKLAEEALREVEEQLRQAQKMEAVGRLAGGIAHDFNNLLTVMGGYTEMALALVDQSGPAYGHIEQIRQASERAAALTRQLLAFSRRQLLEPTLFDLNDLVRHLGSMLRRLIGEDIRLTITCAPSPSRILADAGQLEQVIMNLAVNARDAMPDGGSLVIQTSATEFGDTRASRFGVPPGRYVTLTVSDTGYGMDADTLSRLFEPFFTTKPSGKGTGLGLATAYGIVRQSGGGMAAESAPGAGSCFTVCLPNAEQGPAPTPPNEASSPDAGGSEVILLVEDDDVVRELVSAILRSRGYMVLEAANGNDAIRLSNERASPIHLMLSDSVMPDIGGRELAQRMTILRPDMRLLLMSGYTDDMVLQLQIRNRDVAFLRKPFSSEALARKVREVLDSE
jgi:PAS domain S-box-containing protein